MAENLEPEIRRRRIFDAALDVCAALGYQATTVEEVAALAGTSKGGLYHHFQSKEDLFLGLLEQLVTDLSEELPQTLKHSPNAAEALRRLMDQLPAKIRQRPTLMPAINDLFHLGIRSEAVRLALNRYYDELVRQGAQVIKLGISQGEFAQHNDPYQLAECLFTAGDGMLLMGNIRCLTDGVQSRQALVELLISALVK